MDLSLILEWPRELRVPALKMVRNLHREGTPEWKEIQTRLSESRRLPSLPKEA